jgi:hypothetical protein
MASLLEQNLADIKSIPSAFPRSDGDPVRGYTHDAWSADKCRLLPHNLKWVALTESLKILCRSSSAKGVVRSVMVESVSEGVDEGLQLVDSMRQI